MKELNEYRSQLIKRLIDVTREFRDACLSVQDPFALLEEGGWNVHQVAVHTRDVNHLVYGFRAQKTAEEENPEFANFDGDAYMEKHYNANEPLSEILDGFAANVETLAGMLRALPKEAWSRESRHTTFGGGFTLQTWIERDLAHIEEHLKVVKKGV
jgi:hypothetical protein